MLILAILVVYFINGFRAGFVTIIFILDRFTSVMPSWSAAFGKARTLEYLPTKLPISKRENALIFKQQLRIQL